jgi:hypothetical protein
MSLYKKRLGHEQTITDQRQNRDTQVMTARDVTSDRRDVVLKFGAMDTHKLSVIMKNQVTRSTFGIRCTYMVPSKRLFDILGSQRNCYQRIVINLLLSYLMFLQLYRHVRLHF